MEGVGVEHDLVVRKLLRRLALREAGAVRGLLAPPIQTAIGDAVDKVCRAKDDALAGGTPRWNHGIVGRQPKWRPFVVRAAVADVRRIANRGRAVAIEKYITIKRYITHALATLISHASPMIDAVIVEESDPGALEVMSDADAASTDHQTKQASSNKARAAGLIAVFSRSRSFVLSPRQPTPKVTILPACSTVRLLTAGPQRRVLAL